MSQCRAMQDAISVIETDCEVEFAAPLDYVEPSRQPVEPIEVSDDEAGALPPLLGSHCCVPPTTVYVIDAG